MRHRGVRWHSAGRQRVRHRRRTRVRRLGDLLFGRVPEDVMDHLWYAEAAGSPAAGRSVQVPHGWVGARARARQDRAAERAHCAHVHEFRAELKWERIAEPVGPSIASEAGDPWCATVSGVKSPDGSPVPEAFDARSFLPLCSGRIVPLMAGLRSGKAAFVADDSSGLGFSRPRRL